VQWLPLGQTAFSNASRFRMVLFNDHPSVIEHHLSPTMIQHFSGGLRNGMPAPVLNRTCIISLPPHCLVGQSLNWISLVLASMSVLDRVPSCQRASPAHLGRDINKNLHLFFELFELCISYTCWRGRAYICCTHRCHIHKRVHMTPHPALHMCVPKVCEADWRVHIYLHVSIYTYRWFDATVSAICILLVCCSYISLNNRTCVSSLIFWCSTTIYYIPPVSRFCNLGTASSTLLHTHNKARPVELSAQLNRASKRRSLMLMIEILSPPLSNHLNLKV
jgi:hypothetical protein